MLSRIEKLRADRDDETFDPEMPPVAVARHLIDYLWEVGPAMASGAGPTPVTSQEIAAWQANTGIRLQPWEARFLRRLSSEYVTELHRAEKRDRKAPYPSLDLQPAPSAVAKSLRASMREMAQM